VRDLEIDDGTISVRQAALDVYHVRLCSLL
jgi:hypothetical protein